MLFRRIVRGSHVFLAEGGEEHNAAPIGLWNVLVGA